MGKVIGRRRLLIGSAVVAVAGLSIAGATASQADNGSRHAPAHHTTSSWAGTWATSPVAAGAGASKAGFTDQSVRMIVHTSIGGQGVRIRLADTFGTQPLKVGHATVALPSDPASGLKPGTVHSLTFGGDQGVTIPRGGQVLSDPLRMTVPAVHDLAVTIYLPVATGPATWHWTGQETSYLASGDHSTDTSGSAYSPASGSSYFFLTGVDVLRSDATRDVVVLGDSITDGNGTVVNSNTRWSDQLAARISNCRHCEQAGVLNAGLAGGRLNYDGADVGYPEVGPNALARLDRDVFGQTGVQSVVVQLGINDINAPPFENADDVITGLKQVATQAHQKHLRIVVTTLTPFQGAAGWSAAEDAIRQTVNSYIRHNHDFDGVLDFDATVRDPGQPNRLLPSLDSGDHIHPNADGYHKIATAIPLGVLF